MELTAAVSFLELTMSLSASMGIDPDIISRKSGPAASVLKQPESRISSSQFDVIWNDMEALSEDENFGLHLGEKVSDFPGHLIFLLMLSAPTVKVALEKLCTYSNLLTDFLIPVFVNQKKLAGLAVRFYEPAIPATRHVHESLLSAYAAILRRITGNKITFETVCFSHWPPEDLSEHRRIFQSSLQFNQAENKIMFHPSYLDIPIPMADEETFNTLEQLAKKNQEKIYGSYPWNKKVQWHLMDLLGKAPPSIHSIAQRLAVSPRSLQGHLKRENLTYQEVVKTVRKKVAVRMLEEGHLSISEIGFLVGYSEQSVFSKAFRTWFGISPSQYREERYSFD